MLVLSGAPERLKSVLVVHTEVCFVQLYKSQPPFADIDVYMRAQGFLLHRILLPTGRTFKPLIFNNDVNAAMSQWLWGDAVYVRDFMAFETIPCVDLLKLAAILHENYGSFDLAAVALEAHDRMAGSGLQKRYIPMLVGGTDW